MNREAKVTVIPDTAKTYHLIERVAALEAERDALAAHVEAWRNAMMNAIKSRGDMRQLMALVHANPETSLIQRDARVANEIADWVEGFVSPANTSPQANAGRDIVKQIRKRANEIEAGDDHES